MTKGRLRKWSRRRVATAGVVAVMAMGGTAQGEPFFTPHPEALSEAVRDRDAELPSPVTPEERTRKLAYARALRALAPETVSTVADLVAVRRVATALDQVLGADASLAATLDVALGALRGEVAIHRDALQSVISRVEAGDFRAPPRRLARARRGLERIDALLAEAASASSRTAVARLLASADGASFRAGRGLIRVGRRSGLELQDGVVRATIDGAEFRAVLTIAAHSRRDGNLLLIAALSFADETESMHRSIEVSARDVTGPATYPLTLVDADTPSATVELCDGPLGGSLLCTSFSTRAQPFVGYLVLTRLTRRVAVATFAFDAEEADPVDGSPRTLHVTDGEIRVRVTRRLRIER